MKQKDRQKIVQISIFVGQRSIVRIGNDKKIGWSIKSKYDLEELIKMIQDKYGKDTQISMTYVEKGLTKTINSELVKDMVFPTINRYKRIRYEPDRMVEVSVSNKDIQAERIERLKRSIFRARKSGNEALVDSLFDEYLKLNL